MNVVSFAAGGTHSLAIIPGPPLAAPPQLLASASGFVTNRAFRLVFTATADANYDVWFSTNLANWILLGPAEKFSTGLFQFVDASATNSPYRFYRASAP